ncbi:MAG TPA: xanthine dehydrogenase family protein subunit M [Candidatus Acidoferrales bacterium]|nr:xanthine dehydrogenase family protein subunit M [Candidatus Acidoferrales bacterium]
MGEFEFQAPATLAEALGLLGAEGAFALGGGTSLVLMLKQDLVPASRVVWLGRIPELHGIRHDAAGGLVLGATTTMAELARSSDVRRLHPALAAAAEQIGNPRVRAVATVGGALAHADPRQDLPPVLLALGAAVTVQGPAGTRSVPLAGFFRSLMETALADGELVTSVSVPPPAPGQRECYLRFNPGSVDDFPTVGVAARAVLDESGAISDLAVALGGVAPVPILIREAPTDAAEAAERACDPVDDRRGSAAYKRAMARVWTRRALAQLLG